MAGKVVAQIADLLGVKKTQVDPVMQKLIAIGQKGLKSKEIVKAKEQKRISEFDNVGDMVLTMIMVALMHANPDKDVKDIIEEGREWSRKLWQPGTKHLWRTQAMRIEKHGVRAEASKIRREMFKLL